MFENKGGEKSKDKNKQFLDAKPFIWIYQLKILSFSKNNYILFEGRRSQIRWAPCQLDTNSVFVDKPYFISSYGKRHCSDVTGCLRVPVCSNQFYFPCLFL